MQFFNLYMSDTKQLRDKRMYSEGLAQMDPARKTRIQRLGCEGDRIRSLAAGLLLQKSLAALGMPDVKMDYKAGGQPYFPLNPFLYVSLTHAGSWAACSLSSAPAGIDLEVEREINMRVAYRFYCVEEQKRLDLLESEERKQLFLRYWTGKESYGKLTGKGLAYGPQRFVVCLEEGRIRDAATREPLAWLREYSMPAGVFLTACCTDNCMNGDLQNLSLL